MITRNPYVDLCLAVQAIRRDVERVRTPLAPAIGVAASIYTHQLANTLRVLSDIRVRHLLADEVGLGKTVQALMVLNALRSERSDLRVLVVVPDRLVGQWRDEILTRAHTAPIGDDLDSEGTQYIRLAWEDQLKKDTQGGTSRWSLSDIDSANYDVLVVDELHRLRADVQDRIVRAASTFEHVLILTATPSFQKPERHAQLFAILEPERTAVARWRTVLSPEGMHAEPSLSVADDLSKWPVWATRSVLGSFLEQDSVTAASCPDDDESREAAAIEYCAYRRVIRTRRVDYSGVLPRRRHIHVVTEPLGAEVKRQSLMWRYFGYLNQLSFNVDPILLAKRVILSPPSLEQRVDFLRRKGHDRDGLLELVKPLVHRSQGDSRADALVDLLAEIWTQNPMERVLVAAQDNLTVDYIFDMVQARLPMIGPWGQRIPLVAARLRQGMMTDAMDDLGGFGNETNENLEAFQRGTAQVLFAPEAAQVGLNLQCARILVLYSVPWRPEEVEQWVGRLDRIGNTAAFSADGEAKSIDVYTITQKGLVDEKVVTVLKRFNVFENSVNLDGGHLEEVAEKIEAAALRPESVNWHELEDATEAMAVEDVIQELDSALRPWLPWTVDWATSLHQQIKVMQPVEPVLIDLPDHSNKGPRSWQRAFEGMVKLLKRATEYQFRLNDDPRGGRFSSLWYQFGERGMYGKRDVQSHVVFSFGADPGHERSPRHSHAFITRRKDISMPPRRSVVMTFENEKIWRPLHFLNYGDPLHDEIIRGWIPRVGATCAIDVTLFDDHALFSYSDSGLHLLRFSVLDPATVLKCCGVEARVLEDMGRAAVSTASEKLGELLEPHIKLLRCALEADARWLRTQFPAELNIDGLRCSSGQWTIVDVLGTLALLNPMAHGRKGIPQSIPLDLSEEEIQLASVGLGHLREGDKSIAKNAWSHRFPSFDRELALRRQAVLVEGFDAEALASLELAEAERRLEQAQERGNQAQISRAETARNAYSDVLEITRVLWASRGAWIEESSTAIRSISPIEHMVALIRVRSDQ